VEDFLHALRNGREAAVVDLVDRHVERGIREERVYLDLLAPAARRLGELWEEDRANYFQVTLLVGRIQGLVHRLGRNRFEPTRPEHAGETRSVLLAAPAGEQHTLGLVIVGELFLRGGWSVAMGRPMDPAPTAERVAREWFDLVGLSVSRDVTLEDARDAIRAIRRESRNRNVRVILGGRVCSGSPEAIRSLGADSWASDGEDAVAVAKKLCRGDS
jgi:methanogenic corrinoid protein MtbC1